MFQKACREHCQDVDGRDEGSCRSFAFIPGSPATCLAYGVLGSDPRWQGFLGIRVGMSDRSVQRRSSSFL